MVFPYFWAGILIIKRFCVVQLKDGRSLAITSLKYNLDYICILFISLSIILCTEDSHESIRFSLRTASLIRYVLTTILLYLLLLGLPILQKGGDMLNYSLDNVKVGT